MIPFLSAQAHSSLNQFRIAEKQLKDFIEENSGPSEVQVSLPVSIQNLECKTIMILARSRIVHGFESESWPIRSSTLFAGKSLNPTSCLYNDPDFSSITLLIMPSVML